MKLSIGSLALGLAFALPAEAQEGPPLDLRRACRSVGRSGHRSAGTSAEEDCLSIFDSLSH